MTMATGTDHFATGEDGVRARLQSALNAARVRAAAIDQAMAIVSDAEELGPHNCADVKWDHKAEAGRA